MNKVMHFEIPADDVERAKAFYTKSFSWQTQDIPEMKYTIARSVEVDENQMPKEPGAINGGIFKRESDMPHPQFYIDVDDIDKALEHIEEHGGKLVRGKTPVGDMGFVANFKDTEGNVLGLWESAKK